MADRVFPNNTNVDMGSKISFSGIDWTSVEQNMQKNKYASSQDEQIQELLKMAEMAEGMGDYAVTEDMLVESMEDCEDGDEAEETEETEETEAMKEKPESRTSKSNTTMKKIAFTHPSQISAEAIEAAEAAGDTKLVNTILAARKANRQRIAGVIEAKMTKEAKLATRAAQREAIIRLAETMEEEVPKSQLDDMTVEDLQQLVDSFKGNAPEYFTKALEDKKALESAPEVDTEDTGSEDTGNEVMAFTSPTKFSRAQRVAFNKVALSLGMPQEYVNSMCAPVYSKKVMALANEVKEVLATNVSQNTKNSLVTSLIKEAKLSADSKSEFIDYWNNVLGYQDKDFWPQVAADYDNGKKVN